MLTRNFQQALLMFLVFLIIVLIVYGLYCRYKSRSFIGTGRVTDIEAWSLKATLSWLASFLLAIAGIVTIVLD